MISSQNNVLKYRTKGHEQVYDEQSVDPLVHVYLALQPSQMKDSASANFILLESYPGCTKLCKNISQSLSLDIFFLAAGTYLQYLTYYVITLL